MNTINTLVSNAGVYDEKEDPIGAVEVIKDNTVYLNLRNNLEMQSEQLGSVSEKLAATSQQVSSLSMHLSDQSVTSLDEAKKWLELSNQVSQKSTNCNDFAMDVKKEMIDMNNSMSETVSLTKN